MYSHDNFQMTCTFYTMEETSALNITAKRFCQKSVRMYHHSSLCRKSREKCDKKITGVTAVAYNCIGT